MGVFCSPVVFRSLREKFSIPHHSMSKCTASGKLGELPLHASNSVILILILQNFSHNLLLLLAAEIPECLVHLLESLVHSLKESVSLVLPFQIRSIYLWDEKVGPSSSQATEAGKEDVGAVSEIFNHGRSHDATKSTC